MRFLLGSVLFSISLLIQAVFNQQSAGVRGRLLCDATGDTSATIRLYDEFVDLEEKLGESRPEHDGRFQVSGGVQGFSKMRVMFKVFTNCNNAESCPREITFEVPDNYVTRTAQVKRWYDIGDVDFGQKFDNETMECL